LTFAVLFLYLLRTSHLNTVRASAVFLVGSFGILLFLNVVRPQMYTFLFFAMTLIAIAEAEHGHYGWLWSLPVIMVLWVNTHGGFLAGLAMLGIWAVLHLIVHRDAWRRIVPPVLITLLATLINPYGIDLVSFLLRTATVPRPEIAEWQPLPLVSLAGLAYLTVLAIAVVALNFSQRQKNWILLVLFGVAAWLPWISIRHLPLFCIAFLVLIGEHVGSAWTRRLGNVPSNRQHLRWLGVIPLIAAIVVLVIGFVLSRGRIEIERNSFLPTAAMHFLKAGGVEGNLATHFDW